VSWSPRRTRARGLCPPAPFARTRPGWITTVVRQLSLFLTSSKLEGAEGPIGRHGGARATVSFASPVLLNHSLEHAHETLVLQPPRARHRTCSSPERETHSFLEKVDWLCICNPSLRGCRAPGCTRMGARAGPSPAPSTTPSTRQRAPVPTQSWTRLRSHPCSPSRWRSPQRQWRSSTRWPPGWRWSSSGWHARWSSTSCPSAS